MMFGIGQYIYFEGDDVSCIFFLKKGSMGYVLPKYNNFKFIDIGHGNSFGIVDIISSMLRHEEIEADQWFIRKDLLKRQFTMMADSPIEVLSLSILDMYRL